MSCWESTWPKMCSKLSLIIMSTLKLKPYLFSTANSRQESFAFPFCISYFMFYHRIVKIAPHVYFVHLFYQLSLLFLPPHMHFPVWKSDCKALFLAFNFLVYHLFSLSHHYRIKIYIHLFGKKTNKLDLIEV